MWKAKIGTCNIKQYDVSNLKDPDVKEEFNITIINRYSTLQDETAVTIDQFHQAVTENATEVIGYKKINQIRIVNQKHVDPMEERKQLKKFLDTNAPRLKKRAAA